MMKIATLVAVAAATACHAAPKIRTADGNLHLDVDAGGDVVFMQMGGYSHRLSNITAATAELQAGALAGALAVAESLDDIRGQATTDRAAITTNNDSVTRALQGLSADISAALRGPNSAIANLTRRIEGLESSSNDPAASLGTVRVNVSRRVQSGGYNTFSRHRCSYTGGNPVNNPYKHVQWSGSHCTRNSYYSGVPQRSRGCETTLSWTSQSGPDEEYRSYRPDESEGARIAWRCGTSGSGCGANPTVRSFYYCFGAQSAGSAGGDCAGDDCTAAELMKMARRAARPQLEALYPQNISSFTRSVCTVNFADVDWSASLSAAQPTAFYKFAAGNCTGGRLPEGLCDATVRTSTNRPEMVVMHASNPLDESEAGIFLKPRDETTGTLLQADVATVVYQCYGRVNLAYNVVANSVTPAAQTVHRCIVPRTGSTYIRPRGIQSSSPQTASFTHRFQASDCTNGLPTGDCDAMLSKTAQSGEDEGYMVYPPSEGGARISWIVSNPGSTSPPIIDTLYMCYRRQPTSFTRHTCTQRGRGGSISFQTGNCVCQGQRCTAPRMRPQQRISQGASCDAHESWQRQQVSNGRGDEDWRVYNDRIIWWNSAHQTDAYTRVVIYCFNP
jgi:hypothetical protein